MFSKRINLCTEYVVIGPENERIISAVDKFSLTSGLFSLYVCNMALKSIFSNVIFKELISCVLKFSFVNISE